MSLVCPLFFDKHASHSWKAKRICSFVSYNVSQMTVLEFTVNDNAQERFLPSSPEKPIFARKVSSFRRSFLYVGQSALGSGWMCYVNLPRCTALELRRKVETSTVHRKNPKNNAERVHVTVNRIRKPEENDLFRKSFQVFRGLSMQYWITMRKRDQNLHWERFLKEFWKNVRQHLKEGQKLKN